MSTTRARLLIACVWVSSFVICLPPLVGWRDKRVCIGKPAANSVLGVAARRSEVDRCPIVVAGSVFSTRFNRYPLFAVASHVQRDVSPVQPVQHHHYTRADKAVPMDLRIDQRHRLRHLQVAIAAREKENWRNCIRVPIARRGIGNCFDRITYMFMYMSQVCHDVSGIQINFLFFCKVSRTFIFFARIHRSIRYSDFLSCFDPVDTAAPFLVFQFLSLTVLCLGWVLLREVSIFAIVSSNQQREKSFQRCFLTRTRRECNSEYAPYQRLPCIHLFLKVMLLASPVDTVFR